ncbi:O-antigen ligase family protein [Thermomonas sp. HDW16]|uniref:O-antigen ligase family protein n=1 Tax=Thermomonas sp. HDW16 TaxID=2714945 RepID=UPI00140C78D7|nr:O-antigen ligase family protein [Thermomonas sp. HDW16]QIL20505.1 O-antigen ligase family protein [Thermomonas sp. HDW16]
MAFGLFQVGLPPNSAMRLYIDNGSGIGGVLVNANHQGTALIVGMLLAVGLWADEYKRARESRRQQAPKAVGYAAAALICLVAVTLTGSSGAMVIAILAFAIAVPATGLLSIRRIRSSGRGMAVAMTMAVLLGLGLFSAQGWVNMGQTDAMRYELAHEAVTSGMRHAPFGSGAGTFVDSFAQSSSPLFEHGGYVNHAHNEFAQWWFEAGWPAVLLMIVVLGIVALCGWKLLRSRRPDPVVVACWLAVVAILVHSWVDFPLRTLSLMSLAAFICGVVVTAVGMLNPSVTRHGPSAFRRA